MTHGKPASSKNLGIVPASLRAHYGTSVTRTELCALAVGLYEAVTGTEITERMTFSDTTDVNVQKMGILGVVNDTVGSKFSPNAHLSRCSPRLPRTLLGISRFSPFYRVR